MKSLFLPSADSPVLSWLLFGFFLVLLCVCIGGAIVWMNARGAKGKRKRKLRHHRPTNPTLAQTGGLPPKRDPDEPPPGP
jgi:hypothetical protein